MSDGFSWIQPRNIYGIIRAMKASDSYAEKVLLRKMMYRGIVEWTLIVALFSVFIAGILVVDSSVSTLIASN